ncbi:MAG TPA: aldo/keto reductase [Blastocatellia bacterium]|nr:aldo/keto reductase [Blastocatellia bacterium]
MRQVYLGKSKVPASVLGLGTVKFGRNQKTKYPQPFELPGEEHLSQLVKTAADLGINLLDTAPAYGSSEVRLGEIMERAGWFGSRSSWVICTKAGEEFEGGLSQHIFRPEHLKMSAERSCQRLKTDYLDLVLLHSDPTEKCLLGGSEAMGALCKLRERGLVRLVGASCYTIPGARMALHAGADVLMLTVNQHDQSFLELLPELESLGIGILIKKPFNSGFLSQTREAASEALRFLFEQTPTGITSVIVGTLNLDHLKHHCHTAEQFYG